MSDIASSIGVDRTYLYKIFKKELGVSPVNYLLDYKLDRAAALMAHDGITIGEIAVSVGFCDAAHFTKTFSECYGCTPGQFRKEKFGKWGGKKNDADINCFFRCKQRIFEGFRHKRKNKDMGDMLQFNAFISTVWIVILAIILFAAAFVVHGVKKEKIPHMTALSWRYVLICGVMSCVYQRLNISLAAVIPSVVFFPVANGSMAILSTVLGRTVFKEKLKTVQLFGIILGLFSIITIGLSKGILSLFK